MSSPCLNKSYVECLINSKMYCSSKIGYTFEENNSKNEYSNTSFLLTTSEKMSRNRITKLEECKQVIILIIGLCNL